MLQQHWKKHSNVLILYLQMANKASFPSDVAILSDFSQFKKLRSHTDKLLRLPDNLAQGALNLLEVWSFLGVLLPAVLNESVQL